MLSVPRLYEKMYARIGEKVANDSALKRAIFRWALGVGNERFRHQVARTKPGAWLTVRQALADKLVFDKIKERVGGKIRLLVSGGAPLGREIALFFGAAGLPILEGYGLTETSPVIAVNLPDRMKPGTVGPVLDGVEVKIAPDGEILVRGPNVMKGYYKKPEATAEALDQDGFFHTGDIGHLDADGFLAITDRKKDILVTSGGKNIAPQPIENRLKTDRFFAEVVMIGDKRHFAVALVVPNFDLLERWGRERRPLLREPRGAPGPPRSGRLLPEPDRRAAARARTLREDQEADPPRPRVHARRGRADPHPQGEAPRDRAEVQRADRPDVRRWGLAGASHEGLRLVIHQGV